MLVEKDSRVEGFCFRYIRMNVVISFSLSLERERERGGTLVTLTSRIKASLVEFTSRVVGSFSGRKRV